MQIRILVFLLGTLGVKSECNIDDHHPQNGGYFIEGINGFVKDDSGTGISDPNSELPGHTPYIDATWAPGIDYPYGSLELCTGRFCSEECRTKGCPDLIYGHTCSQIRFCYAEDSGSDVWLVPNEVDLANCNFTNAVQVCNESEGADDDCCNYQVEEDGMLDLYLFASKNGCSEGQKAAILIDDYDSVGDQCYAMGKTSSRIEKCTCHEASTLSDPCHSEFRQGCLANSPDDISMCCEEENCLMKTQNITHPDGVKAEDDRQALCRDDLAGLCAIPDEDGDCCTKTCSECGIALHPKASWQQCSSGNRTSATGSCGTYFTPQTCDFSSCETGDKWHVESDLYENWIGVIDTSTSSDAVDDVHSQSSTTSPVPTTSPVTSPTSDKITTSPVASPTADEKVIIDTKSDASGSGSKSSDVADVEESAAKSRVIGYCLALSTAIVTSTLFG